MSTTIQNVVKALQERRVDEAVIETARGISAEELSRVEWMTANLVRAVAGANPDPALREIVNATLFGLLPKQDPGSRNFKKKVRVT